jgi:iron complex outermembrane receptor protein
MRTNKAIITVLILIVFPVININLAFSQDDQTLDKMAADEELEQEMAWLRAETYVITASKVKETIKKAPASITVITDKQIRQMGATSLVDVMRIVPGFTAGKSPLHYYLYFVRGNFSGAGSNSTLLLINNHPINDARFGGFAWMHDTLIIDNIKRIEFIRGPSSALYGANALDGVINVITKEAEDVEGFELTARGGSYDTQQYNFLYGKSFSDLEVAFNFNYFKTHGYLL